MENVLEVSNLSKHFGDFVAVKDISFSLKEGEILGFLGINGAGKTTTIQMLLGVLTPTSGKINYFGKDFSRSREEILQKVNFSSTYTNLPWNLTVEECLYFISQLYKIDNRRERVKKIVTLFKLEELKSKHIYELSAGQLTRINLVKAFVNFPKVLLLDEPTASLDPEIAASLRKTLLEDKDEFNTAMILTSHNMAEVEEMCDRVIFLNNGEIIANDTPEELAKTIQVAHVSLHITTGMKNLEEYCTRKKIAFILQKRTILIDMKEKDIASFLQDIHKNGINYSEISIEKPTLEDYFLQVVGGAI